MVSGSHLCPELPAGTIYSAACSAVTAPDLHVPGNSLAGSPWSVLQFLKTTPKEAVRVFAEHEICSGKGCQVAKFLFSG